MFEAWVTNLPDLREYARQQVIPNLPDLFAAMDEHRRLVDAFREADADKDDARARLTNLDDPSRASAAIARAIEAGKDPDEAADQFNADLERAKADEARARTVYAAYRKPILQASWHVMNLLADHREQLLPVLDKTTEAQADTVQKAQSALNRAAARYEELGKLGQWLRTTEPSNDPFPIAWGLQMMLSPDSADAVA